MKRSLIIVLSLSLFLMSCSTESDDGGESDRVVAEKFRGEYKYNIVNAGFVLTATEIIQYDNIIAKTGYTYTFKTWTEGNNLYIDHIDLMEPYLYGIFPADFDSNKRILVQPGDIVLNKIN